MGFTMNIREPSRLCTYHEMDEHTEIAHLVAEGKYDEALAACPKCKGEGRYPLRFPYYVTVYQVDQAYGGREEGGWWYDIGTVLETFQVYSEEHLAIVEKELEAYYNDPDDRRLRWGRTSAAGGYDIDIVASESMGRSYPEERPRYE